MSLQELLPWTKKPIIINAPMAGVASAPLAIAVTQAGGLGQIGLHADLADLRAQLTAAAAALPRTPAGFLPVGVGIISFLLTHAVPAVLDVLRDFAPQVVWLFAAEQPDDYAVWARALRAALPPGTLVWVQVGSVAGALAAAASAAPDVLCVQGSDAGGHGLEAGAGVVALLPEVADALAEAGYGGVPLVGAGGIVDGRGAAAALALGAQGVVLGTRFLSAPEAKVHPAYRRAVIGARDGGQRTVRSKLFDELRGPNKWPAAYDGRSIVTQSYKDHEQGVGLEELREKFADAVKANDAGYADEGKGRATMWAGTAVGSVKREQAAGEIVEEVRQGVIAALEAARSRL